jgi:hypothetical protein
VLLPILCTSGFCRHQVPGFGPWHRAYLRQFELALLDSARAAAAQFLDDDLRSRYEAEAEKIRLCYWDWVSMPLLHICNYVGSTAFADPATSQANWSSHQHKLRMCHMCFLQYR